MESNSNDNYVRSFQDQHIICYLIPLLDKFNDEYCYQTAKL